MLFFVILSWCYKENLDDNVYNNDVSVCNYENNKELDNDLKNDYKNKLLTINEKIKSFTWATSENFLYYIDKSRYEQYLWNYCEAIKTLELTKKLYWTWSSIIFNNLWSIYEEVWDYKKAIKEYLYIVENNLDDNLSQYYKKIVFWYIELRDYENAKNYYIKYEKSGWNRDYDFINKIKNLK